MSCSTVPQLGPPSTFPGRRLALRCSLADAGLKSGCAGLQTGRGTLLPPQLTHTLAQCSGCADALAFRFPSSGTQSGIVKSPNRIILCMSLHEKYADSDETISTPMQLPASVSPSIMSCLWHFQGNQCSFSPVSPPTQGTPQGRRASSSSAAAGSFVFFLK